MFDLGGNQGSTIRLRGNLGANIRLGRRSQALGWVGSRLWTVSPVVQFSGVVALKFR